MPLYPIHGFKWDRVSAIIKHINYNHVRCASPSWNMLDRSSSALLANFRKLWPGVMTRLPNLYWFDEYDPSAEDQSLLDWAFVADEVVTLNALSVDLNSFPSSKSYLQTKPSRALWRHCGTNWQRERKFNGLLYNGDSDRGVSGELGELSEGEGGDESG